MDTDGHVVRAPEWGRGKMGNTCNAVNNNNNKVR